MKILKWLFGIIAGLILLIGAGLALASLFYRGVPPAEVEAKWATPPSKFIVVDGVRMHYRDSGQGPVVVLLHANYANLFMWEPWAKALEGRYRVIRVDLPAHGLTGPDPTGVYKLERIVQLFEGFVDALELREFSLAGASIGGTIAMHYTGRHPERVERLILMNPGSLEKDVRGRDTPPNLPRAANILAYVTPRSLAGGLLRVSFGDSSKVTESMIDEWYELWMREGNRMAMLDLLRQYVSGDVEGKIRAVRVPVLLIWGEKNPRVPLALAYEFQKLLTNASSVKLVVLPGVGHMAVHEAPVESARAAREFLDSSSTATATAAAAAP